MKWRVEASKPHLWRHELTLIPAADPGPPCRRPSRPLLPAPQADAEGAPLLLLLGLGIATPGGNLFVKVANPGWTPKLQWGCIPVWADYDGDGWIDLFLNPSPAAIQTRISNRLYRNNRDGTFTRMLAAEVGPLVDDAPLPNAFPGMRFWVDVNNDGALDLLLLLLAGTDDGRSQAIPGRLYLNDGSGRFSSVEAGALNQPRLGFSANSGCVSDYDNDGWLDVFITGAWGHEDATHNLLLHGRGDGAFERVTDNSIALDEIHGNVVDGIWSDIGNDGHLDIMIADSQRGVALYRDRGQPFRHWRQGPGQGQHRRPDLLATTGGRSYGLGKTQ